MISTTSYFWSPPNTPPRIHKNNPQLSSITCTLEFHLVTLSRWGKCPIIHHQHPKGPQLQSSTSHVENVHNEHHRYHGNIYRNPVIQHIVLLSQCNDLIHPLLAGHCSFTHRVCAPSTSKKNIDFHSIAECDYTLLWCIVFLSKLVYTYFSPCQTFYKPGSIKCLLENKKNEDKAKKGKTAYLVIKRKYLFFKVMIKTRQKL